MQLAARQSVDLKKCGTDLRTSGDYCYDFLFLPQALERYSAQG